jgi:hypothetical protein
VRHLTATLVVSVAVLGASAHADPPAKPSPFGTKSYGEGGGYKHPDAAVGQYFETKPDLKPEGKADAKPEKKPEPKPEPIAKVPSKITPEIKQVVVKPSRPRPRPFAVKPDLAPAVVKTEAAKEDALLLNTAVSAPKIGTQPVASAAAVTGGDDAASDDARRDYEARLFGAAPGPMRAGLADSAKPNPAQPGIAESVGEGMLFVSLELEPQEAGALRDSVAGLGSAAAFRPDARFQPLPGEGGSVRISGWLPASRLGDAITRPGVRRVSVERGSRPAGDIRVAGAYLVKLRLNDAAHPEESIAEGVRDLSFMTGFKLDRVLGTQVQPGAGATALVSGTMPVSQLSRALAIASVVEINPSLSEAAELAAAPAPLQEKESFLKYVMARSMWLVLLTVLLALPLMGDAVKKALSVFVPYR